MAVTTGKNGVGIALRAVRLAAGMTLRDVSGAANISYTYLSNVENGNVEPSAKWVHMVIETIGQHIEDAA
jgi:DNA-binding XRE family transcriptional regulator